MVAMVVHVLGVEKGKGKGKGIQSKVCRGSNKKKP
jgi:hypothetical protein